MKFSLKHRESLVVNNKRIINDSGRMISLVVLNENEPPVAHHKPFPNKNPPAPRGENPS